MKIIVDAFGGDNAPLDILKGSAAAVAEFGCEIILTGDENIIKSVAEKENISLANMEIVHTSTVMSFCDEPTTILKSNRETSIGKGFDLLADSKGDAFVTAGSTGAALVGATFIVKRIKGISRPALAPVIPSQTGCYMLIDCGANVDCRPETLLQFGIMGSAYMEKIIGIPSPRVALANIGEEETKGGQLQIDAYKLLANSPLNFTGNIEARYIPRGDCDVVVCDGFTGNIILKLSEGLAKFFSNMLKDMLKKSFMTKIAALILMKGIKAFKAKMDYTEYGGAPIMGAKKTVIKAHGSSNAKAFKNAIRQAIEFTNSDVIGKIEQYLESIKQEEVK
jgi:glycerol-3-phosphate acyltransferase PlsX